MNSNDYFLANKCGYGQCCNTIDSTSYINLGGFIFSTRACEDHKDQFIKFIVATMRAIDQDPVCNDIMMELNGRLQAKYKELMKMADDELPYEKSKTYNNVLQQMEDEKEREGAKISTESTVKEFGRKKSKEIKEKYGNGSPAQQ